jgi:hypothetical protein
MKRTCQLLEKELLKDGPLFAKYKSVPWLISPAWFELNAEQILELKKLGCLLYRFLRACNNLYFTNEKVAKLVEQGKPEKVIAVQRAFLKEMPCLIRPDIVLTEDGFKVTEIELVVGGIGMGSKIKEAYLSVIPPPKPFKGSIPGSFLKAVKSIAAKKKILLVPSFSSRYLPELKLFSKVCKRKGLDVEAMQPEKVRKNMRVAMIWRLFEAYEWDKIQLPDEVPIYPPLKQFLEEKIWMALLYCEDHRNYWKTSLGKDFDLLKKYIPPTWIIRENYLPMPLSELMKLGRKKRQYVTKLSGYSEKAWGGRSFTYWGEPSNRRWRGFLSTVMQNNQLYILQQFQRSKKYSFPALINEEIKQVDNLRSRLCPFYFRIGKKVELGDIIVTLRKCKNVHGATDSIRIPVAISP